MAGGADRYGRGHGLSLGHDDALYGMPARPVGVSKSRNRRICRDGFRDLAFAVLRRWVGTSR